MNTEVSSSYIDMDLPKKCILTPNRIVMKQSIFNNKKNSLPILC